jgi:hypothetical protein
VLLRLAYLGLTNTFALLRLLPMSNQDKDTEIVVLRHQIAVLQRQLGGARPCATRRCDPCAGVRPAPSSRRSGTAEAGGS